MVFLQKMQFRHPKIFVPEDETMTSLSWGSAERNRKEQEDEKALKSISEALAGSVAFYSVHSKPEKPRFTGICHKKP